MKPKKKDTLKDSQGRQDEELDHSCEIQTCTGCERGGYNEAIIDMNEWLKSEDCQKMVRRALVDEFNKRGKYFEPEMGNVAKSILEELAKD